MYEVNESFWAYGWIWHIETISIEHNTSHGRVAHIDAEVENLLFQEERVPSDIATLIDGSEETNLYAGDLTVAPNERESVTYEVSLSSEFDDATGERLPYDPADLQIVWGKERQFQARYALDGSEIRTNEPVPVDVPDFSVDGVEYVVHEATIRFDHFHAQFPNDYVYLTIHFTVTDTGEPGRRMHPFHAELPNGRDLTITTLFEDPISGLSTGEPFEWWMHFEFETNEVQSGPITLFATDFGEDKEAILTIDVPAID